MAKSFRFLGVLLFFRDLIGQRGRRLMAIYLEIRKLEEFRHSSMSAFTY